MNLLSVFFTTFSFCVIFIVIVYTVLINIYTVFFGKSGWPWKEHVVGCLWKEPVIVIDLDIHYKHEAVSRKISKSYNFGLLWQLESVLSSNNLNRQEAFMINVIKKWLFFVFH